MGYYLIDHTPPTERNIANMLKTTAVIRFSLEYHEVVKQVRVQTAMRRVIVVGNYFCVTYTFDELLQ
jgi:hypothetical protein